MNALVRVSASNARAGKFNRISVCAFASKRKADPTVELDGAGSSRFNLNSIIDKQYEGMPLKDIISLPPSALQGLTPEKDAVFEKFKIRTIKELAKWKYYKLAQAVVELSAYEESDSSAQVTEGSARINIDSAFDKKYRHMSLKALCDLPPHSMKGMAPWVDEELPKLKRMKNVREFADWKFPRIAAQIVELAKYQK